MEWGSLAKQERGFFSFSICFHWHQTSNDFERSEAAEVMAKRQALKRYPLEIFNWEELHLLLYPYSLQKRLCIGVVFLDTPCFPRNVLDPYGLRIKGLVGSFWRRVLTLGVSSPELSAASSLQSLSLCCCWSVHSLSASNMTDEYRTLLLNQHVSLNPVS